MTASSSRSGRSSGARPIASRGRDRPSTRRSTAEVTALTATPSGFTAFVYDDAVGDSTILTTRDGVTWISSGPLPRTTGSRGGGVDGTVVLGSTILAVGASGSGGVAAWSSTDGLTWTALGHITPGSDATLRAAAPIPSGVAGVGRQGFSAAAWTSPDGAVWTPTAIAGASSSPAPRPRRRPRQRRLRSPAGASPAHRRSIRWSASPPTPTVISSRSVASVRADRSRRGRPRTVAAGRPSVACRPMTPGRPSSRRPTGGSSSAAGQDARPRGRRPMATRGRR